MGSSPSVADPEPSRASLRIVLEPAYQVIQTLVRFGIPAFAFIFPLTVWPGLARPFSSPKLLAWGVVTALFGVVMLAARRKQAAEIPTTAIVSLSLLVACVGISAGLGASSDIESLLLVFTALAWFALLRSAGVHAYPVAIALAAAAGVIAVVSLLQFAGADPFYVAGWFGVGGTDARMHVYATLGNPNFVGAFLSGVLPVSIAIALHGHRLRQIFAVAAMLQGIAIVATGSRAAALGALLGCALLSARIPNSRRWIGLALCLSVALPVLALSPARSLPETVQGRLFVWRVAIPHVSSIPVFGFGPGAFEETFDRWQQEYFGTGNHSEDLHFAARFDHAHNDFLEWTVEYGWAGIGALASCLGLLPLFTRRGGGAKPFSRAAFAGACGLVLIAMVDFPFHRPEGLFLVITLIAMACAGSEMHSSAAKES